MRIKIPALVLLSSLLGMAWAQAHAFLDHSLPAVGSTVTLAPKEVTLWFTEKLEPAFSSIQVLDGNGNRLDAGSQADTKDPSMMTVRLKPLSPGRYVVVWKAVSVDTHITTGSFEFNVK
jgi:copper resistance protein C